MQRDHWFFRKTFPRYFIVLSLLLIPLLGASAQMVRNHDEEEGVRSLHAAGEVQPVSRSFASDIEARAEFTRILSAIGLNWIADRVTLRASADTDNAVAGISKTGERFIFYNASFMQKMKQKTTEHWTLVSILAHEVGHHLAFHTELKGRYHEFELEADYFSGFVLRRLGASLDQAHTAMREISPVKATKTHPALKERLEAITIGWTDGGSQEPPRGLKNLQDNVTRPETALVAASKAVAANLAPRVALVIGNSAYEHVGQIPNTARDAALMTAEFEKRGFKVIRGLNLKKEAMTKVITEFENTLAIVGGTGLFYYAGHAAHIDGEDIMIPIDVKGETKEAVLADGVNLTKLMQDVQSRTSTPLKSNGVAVLYAASKGEMAGDGPDMGNSPFTLALVKALNARDDELSETFRRVRSEIEHELAANLPGHKQTPFFESNLRAPFYLGRPERDPLEGLNRILFFDSCRDNPFPASIAQAAPRSVPPDTAPRR